MHKQTNRLARNAARESKGYSGHKSFGKKVAARARRAAGKAACRDY